MENGAGESQGADQHNRIPVDGWKQAEESFQHESRRISYKNEMRAVCTAEGTVCDVIHKVVIAEHIKNPAKETGNDRKKNTCRKTGGK